MKLPGYLREAARKVYLAAILSRTRLTEQMLKAVWLARFARWCRAHPCHGCTWRVALYEHLMEAEKLDQPIQYLEFGVFEGKTFAWWVEHNKRPGSRFAGFDTFTGLPDSWEWAPKGYFSTGGRPPDLDDARCRFEKGLFQDTLPGFLVGGLSPSLRKVVHLDADLYGSTLFVLVTLAPVLRAGDVLIFDEMDVFMHEFRAFHDFLEVLPLRYEVVGMAGQYTQVALKVL